MIITSFSNQKVKLIRKLEQKKHRQETGLFFIEGLRTVGEAIQVGAPIDSLVIAPELLISEFGQSLRHHPNLADVDQIEVSGEIYQSIAHKDGPQGIGALVRQDWHSLEAVQTKPSDCWLALDEIADPGNLGTILRTADAVGVRGIILLGNTTDPHDPAAVKASMGAIFSQELIRADWGAFTQWRAEQAMTLVGASDSAEADYQEYTYPRPLALLMGSERHGLSAQQQTACDQMVCIPMAGRSDSLNLAVATGILLYEIFNQFRKREVIQP
jgi:RNA methyltransferase, TrmH family